MNIFGKKAASFLVGLLTLSGTAYAVNTLPDLMVDSVEKSDNSQLTFEISNQGEAVDADTDGFVYVYVDDQLAWTYNWKYLQEHGFLNAMGNSLFTSQVPKGKESVKVCVDARNDVEEANEDNNCFTHDSFFGLTEPSTGLADLAVQDIYIDERTGMLTVVQGNIGQVDSPTVNGRTNIYVGGNLQWTYRWPNLTDRSFLNAGGSSVLTPKKVNRNVEVTVCMSTDTVMDELNKNNNCLTKQVRGRNVVRKPSQPFRSGYEYVRPYNFTMPDASINRPDFYVESISIDENDVLSVEFGNKGRTYTGNLGGHVELYLDGRRKRSYSFSELGDTNFYNAGQTSTLKAFPLTGGHQVRVCIDPFDQVREGNDANNCQTTLVK